MQPAPHIVFVKEGSKDLKKNQFEYPDGAKLNNTAYQVVSVGEGVTVCDPGDYVIFENSQEFEYKGEKIVAVNDTDIVGLHRA